MLVESELLQQLLIVAAAVLQQSYDPMSGCDEQRKDWGYNGMEESIVLVLNESQKNQDETAMNAVVGVALQKAAAVMSGCALLVPWNNQVLLHCVHLLLSPLLLQA